MNSTIEALVKLYDRDLTKLAEEISQYTDEALLWKVAKGIKNPAGNLALHLCGNLQHFFGAILLKNGYKRNRDLEFSAKDVPMSEILKEIELARAAVKDTLAILTPADLEKEYPIPVFEDVKPMTTAYFVIHLQGHLNYHLGQVNYHRRLLS